LCRPAISAKIEGMAKLIVLLGLIISQQALAQYQGSYLYKRAEERKASRWTLQEWLETRDRNRLMDLWLAMNSSSPYEAMVGASYNTDRVEISNQGTSTQYNSGSGYLTAHASIIGLSFEHENNVQEKYNDINGMLNLRLFGKSIQGTYLAVHLGQRTRAYSTSLPETDYKNQFGQVSLQLYLTKYYRQYTPATKESLSQEIGGKLSEAGVFLDFRAMRVFGSWYQDVESLKSTVDPLNEVITTRVGTRAGLKFYF
jgi:hypothetical protein